MAYQTMLVEVKFSITGTQNSHAGKCILVFYFNTYVSPGDARYTCYRYSIYVFGILLDLIMGRPSILQLPVLLIDGKPSMNA